MSSAGVTIATPQSYFCYQCNRTVTLTPLPNSDLSCPNCNGGFLEESDSDPPNPNPNSNIFPSSPLFPDPFSLFGDPFFSSAPTTTTASRGPIIFSSTTIDLENPRNFSNLFPSSPSPVAFNPFDFLHAHLQNLRASGANVQFVVDNHPFEGSGSDGGFRLPPNIGDYFLGPGLEQLIQQLAENDPNRYGTPPASKRAVEGLPDVVVTDEVVGSESNSCAVCMNDFEVGLKVKQMPCKHLYHSDCLLPWLELHNSCPVCRFELPTDDPDYENRRANRGQGGSSGGGEGGGQGGSSGGGEGGGQGGSQGGGGQSMERRFRISLPWPFSTFVSPGDGGDNNNSNSGSSSGGQQSGGRGGSSGPMEEGLD